MSTPDSGAPTLVSDLGERGVIERIRRRLPQPPPHLLVGVGDDAAVVEPERGAVELLTTDALVEGIHFDRRFSSSADVGYKALAVNASDIAAMGGTPRLALLSLMLPEGFPLRDLDGLLDGLLAMAASSGIALAGGNITRSPGPLIADVTLTGWCRRRKVLTRNGGRPGDALYVTGTIGAAAAGLGWLRVHAGTNTRPPAGAWPPPDFTPEDDALTECVRRHQRPEARLRVGALLGRTRAARACMDLSDGLADAVAQVAEASGTGARIDADTLPVHEGARRWFDSRREDPIGAAVAGGDDYELLFAVSPRMRGRLKSVIREARVPVTCIGALTAEVGVALVRNGRPEPLPRGFVHF
ncbi:MAG: thiamine-phosphate kinase [Acidobacteria bacterium]|nr:thiamine-phosphate kinase [Acidobacteriota bacterium]MCA1651369.1 thiamine-phosphate kinase [Acidobacteriota bacterium]